MPIKERELVELLLDRTKKRKIKWEATAQENEFVTTLGGEVTVTIGLVRMDDGEHFTRGLTMRDSFGREMLTVTAWSADVDGAVLKELFEEVRRAALNVDETMERILNQLRKTE